MYDNHQQSFNEYLQSMRMTILSLEVWADTDEKKTEVEPKLATLRSMLELGYYLYSETNEKQNVH